MIDNVLSVLGFADKNLPEGIYKWSIDFGVSPEQADTHEAALARVMKLLSELRARGLGSLYWYESSTPDRQAGMGLYENKSCVLADSTSHPDHQGMEDRGKGPTALETLCATGSISHVSLMQSNMGGFVGKTTIPSHHKRNE